MASEVCRPILNDRVLGLLGILAVASSVYPELFDVSEDVALSLVLIEWAVVLAYAADYLVHLLLASDKRAYVLSGWRMLDLGIIATCTLTLFPFFHFKLRRVLALHCSASVRAFGFWLGVRSSLGKAVPASTALAPPPVPHSFTVLWADSWTAQPLPWAEFVSHAGTEKDGWLDAYDVAPNHLEELANSLTMPPALFSILRSASAYPRLKVIGSRLVATLWLPLVKQGDWLEIERVSVLLSLAEHGPLLTIAPTDCQLRQRMAHWLTAQAGSNLETGAAEAFFRMVLEQNEEALSYLEISLRQLEEAPVARVGEAFFRLAFRLRRDLSQIKADLWRLSGILDTIKSRRLHLPRHGKADVDAYIVLSDQADYLYETADNLREQLISLLEFHMNTTSFRINRFMRLLAVATVLAAIPATVSGMLGMNILGPPWPVTLGQVVFCVSLAVLTVLYLFLSGENP